jgi:hypothetical protein
MQVHSVVVLALAFGRSLHALPASSTPVRVSHVVRSSNHQRRRLLHVAAKEAVET